MSLEPGMMIGTSLRLERMVGEGGMGSVWVAEHLTLSIPVAVKFIAPALASQEDSLARFKREATSAAQLRHPHVVQVYDHGVSEEGSPYIVMELLEGEDLGSRLDRTGQQGPAVVTTIVAQVCRALAKAHSLGFVHRDIKPDNIFLTDMDGDLFIKILDFGIAKQADQRGKRMTGTGTTVGTPLYMSPEQALSAKSVDFRADLWSLAVVAYQALTGKPPFDGETMPAVFVAIERGVFEPASSRRPGLPPAVDAWFTKALARNPENRFNSAREMSDAFEAAMRGEYFAPSLPPPPDLSSSNRPAEASQVAHPPTLTGTAVTLKARNRRKIGLFAGLGLLVVLAVGGTLVFRSQNRGTSAAASKAPDIVTADTPLTPNSNPALPPVDSAPSPAASASTSPALVASSDKDKTKPAPIPGGLGKAGPGAIVAPTVPAGKKPSKGKTPGEENFGF